MAIEIIERDWDKNRNKVTLEENIKVFVLNQVLFGGGYMNLVK